MPMKFMLCFVLEDVSFFLDTQAVLQRNVKNLVICRECITIYQTQFSFFHKWNSISKLFSHYLKTIKVFILFHPKLYIYSTEYLSRSLFQHSIQKNYIINLTKDEIFNEVIKQIQIIWSQWFLCLFLILFSAPSWCSLRNIESLRRS